MRIVADEPGTRISDGAVVTIGAYDGVHRGHQAVLRLVHDLAAARELDAVAVTFDRHPASVVRPEHAPKLLTTIDQKLELLAGLGTIDTCLVLAFDEARSKETAEEFVLDVLVERLRARLVVVGADFHFGHRRAGNVAMLESMGSSLGFEVVGLGLVAPDGESTAPYSSTRVRAALAEGDVVSAANLLGRPHAVRAVAAEADDVAVDADRCLPAPGTYRGELLDLDAGSDQPARIVVDRSPAVSAEVERSIPAGTPVELRFLEPDPANA